MTAVLVRPRRLTGDQVEEIVAAYRSGVTAAALSVRFDVSPAAIYARLAQAGCPTRLAARKAGSVVAAELAIEPAPVRTRVRRPVDAAPQEPGWRARAACAGIPDPEVFFTDSARTLEAVQVCRDCPVRTQCLAFATHARITEGVWGGLTPRQRARLAQQGGGSR